MKESTKLGEILRSARIGQGLTQKPLAAKAGTNRTYISRVERDALDASLSTLRKIVETGLGGKLELAVKL
ncbi:MAG: helix-turn-helix domain-containing protein [Pyrinomonadaceae bacterium]